MNAKSTVAFVVNGDVESAMGERARAFAKELAADFDCQVVYRQGGKAAAAWQMFGALWAIRPKICYVLDMAASGVAAVSARIAYLHLDSFSWRGIPKGYWPVDWGRAQYADVLESNFLPSVCLAKTVATYTSCQSLSTSDRTNKSHNH